MHMWNSCDMEMVMSLFSPRMIHFSNHIVNSCKRISKCNNNWVGGDKHGESNTSLTNSDPARMLQIPCSFPHFSPQPQDLSIPLCINKHGSLVPIQLCLLHRHQHVPHLHHLPLRGRHHKRANPICAKSAGRGSGRPMVI